MTVMSRQALFEAAWDRPLTEVADQLGITSTGLKKICDRHDIPTPGRGYWAQVRAGKTFRRPTLRPAKDPRLDDVGIVGARLLSPAVAAAIQKAQALVPKSERRRRAPTANEPQPIGDAQAGTPAPAQSQSSTERKDLAATRRAIMRATADAAGFASVTGQGVVPLKISAAHQETALEFLTQLLHAAGHRGWTLQSGSERARLVVEGEAIAFRLEEQPTKTPHRPTPEDLARKKDRDRWGGNSQPWPTWDLRPSGRLSIAIEENDYSGLRRTYSQRKGFAFEESVDIILTGFAAHAALKVERRREAAERAKAAEEAETRRQRLQAFDHREKRRMEFADAIGAALAERTRLQTVLEHLKRTPEATGEGPKGMSVWLSRRLQALEARLEPKALEISARHAEVLFDEPPGETAGSRWYSREIELHLWVPAEEEGRVLGVSELEWAISEGLITDPGAVPEVSEAAS